MIGNIEHNSDNPWNDIDLDDYENHMKLQSVGQLQTLNRIMKEQFKTFDQLIEGDNSGDPHKGGEGRRGKVMILGIAGGNGLEHVFPGRYDKVYGIDINQDYLEAVRQRYPELDGMLECIGLDLVTEYEKLPKAGYVIADLLVEYIGYEAFRNVISQVEPEAVSCVIQINPEEGRASGSDWVSDSPYIHAFDGLDKVHHQMEEDGLWRCMKDTGYDEVGVMSYPLPNGKCLNRIEFHRSYRDIMSQDI